MAGPRDGRFGWTRRLLGPSCAPPSPVPWTRCALINLHLAQGLHHRHRTKVILAESPLLSSHEGQKQGTSEKVSRALGLRLQAPIVVLLDRDPRWADSKLRPNSEKDPRV